MLKRCRPLRFHALPLIQMLAVLRDLLLLLLNKLLLTLLWDTALCHLLLLTALRLP